MSNLTVLKAAAFTRLCVETVSNFLDSFCAFCSRLHAGVC